MTTKEKEDALHRIFAYLRVNVPYFKDTFPAVIRNATSTGEPVITSKPGSKYKWFFKIPVNGGWTYTPGGRTKSEVYDKVLGMRHPGRGVFAVHGSETSWQFDGGKDPYYGLMEKIRRPVSIEELLVVLAAEGF